MKVRSIREKVLENLFYYLDKAKENLEKNGCYVYEAKDSKEALKIIKELVGEEKLVLKSKTNVGKEIHLKEELRKSGIEIIETDCGDFIIDCLGLEGNHPVIPCYGLTLEKIAEGLSKKLGVKVEPNPESIVNAVRNYVKSKLNEAKIGITGANAISSEGSIFLVENEGNISFVSRLEKHIVLAGIEKVNPTDEDCIKICKAQAEALGIPWTYINVISGPSKTGDIPNTIVKGMYGAKEVHVIFLDNGRRKLYESEFREILMCLGCGACLLECPVFNILLGELGFEHKGVRGIILQFFQKELSDIFKKAYYCICCGRCKDRCPVELDIPELVRKMRYKLIKAGLETEVNKKMIEKIRKYGNTVGEIKGEKVEFFCC